MTCTKPQPKGYQCTREAGHDGPCALVYKPGFWRSLGDAVGELVGSVLYQGPR